MKINWIKNKKNKNDQICMEPQETRNSQSKLEKKKKKNEARRITLPD